jgi:hypothetical protein
VVPVKVARAVAALAAGGNRLPVIAVVRDGAASTQKVAVRFMELPVRCMRQPSVMLIQLSARVNDVRPIRHLG